VESILTLRRFLKARAAVWMSDEHFTVDGTLIDAWANHESFQPKDRLPAIRGPWGRTRTTTRTISSQ
jgi:hypothetical protein